MLTFYLIGAFFFLGTMIIRSWLKGTYRKWGNVRNVSGLTGAETARTILAANGLDRVRVEVAVGHLTDHYVPRTRTIRLSKEIHATPSVSGMAVAAHEVGHALQHAEAYLPLRLRSFLHPIANLGARFGPLAALFGIGLGAAGLTRVGILLFATAVFMQILTLPVEFDASRRARRQLTKLGLVSEHGSRGVTSVLTAAGMTYVAGAATSLAYFIYLVVIAAGRRFRAT